MQVVNRLKLWKASHLAKRDGVAIVICQLREPELLLVPLVMLKITSSCIRRQLT